MLFLLSKMCQSQEGLKPLYKSCGYGILVDFWAFYNSHFIPWFTVARQSAKKMNLCCIQLTTGPLSKVTNPILACFLLHCCKKKFFTFLSPQVKYGLFFSRIPDGCIPVCSRAANVCGHDQHFHGAAPTHCAPATPHASVCQRTSPERVRDHRWQHAASHRPGGGGDAARHQSHCGETLSAVSCRGEEVRSVV